MPVEGTKLERWLVPRQRWERVGITAGCQEQPMVEISFSASKQSCFSVSKSEIPAFFVVVVGNII